MASSYPKVLKIGTQAAYNALASKDTSVLYFTSDTLKIYKGAIDYTQYAKVVATLPTEVADRATGTIYLETSTGKVSFYDGSNWQTISYPINTAMLVSGTEVNVDDNHVPSTKAVKDYVAAIVGGSSDVVKSIAAATSTDTSGAAVNGKIKYTTADDQDHLVTVPGVFVGISDKEVSSEVQAAQFTLTDSDGQTTDYTVPKVVTGIAAKTGTGNNAQIAVTLSSGSHADVTVPGVITGVSWDSTSRVITVTDSDGGSDEITIGKDIFIDPTANNRYENGNIYLYLNDGTQSANPTELVIPVTSLITDYFGDDTDSVSVSIDNTTHKVTADVRIRPDDATTGSEFTNAIKLSSTSGAEGLYVDLSDVETSIDALAEAITWGTF
jgi:YD repeat-containing protein